VSADSRPPDLLAPLRTERWLNEARRKAIHLGSLVMPLAMFFPVLPWPRGRHAWALLLLALVVVAVAVDAIRVHDARVRRIFGRLFGGMIREHERFNLLGSTYLLLAALLAVEIFPIELAATALGFTVLGDALAAMVGKGWGRTRFFGKTLEGALGGLAGCVAWAALAAGTGQLPWGVAMAGALIASLVEFLPIPLDDNLGITLISGYAMHLMWSPT
jgi:dolichol kinase